MNLQKPSWFSEIDAFFRKIDISFSESESNSERSQGTQPPMERYEGGYSQEEDEDEDPPPPPMVPAAPSALMAPPAPPDGLPSEEAPPSPEEGPDAPLEDGDGGEARGEEDGKAKAKVVEKDTLQKRIVGMGTEVPPKSIGDTFMDFFRVLTPKNKMPVVTTTRPRQLPPKTEEEEIRHLKQHEEMLKGYMKKVVLEEEEKKRKKKMQLEKENKVIQHIAIWEQKILPFWEEKKSAPETREMCWKYGIPPKLREKIWVKALGNPLNITRQMYNSLLEEKNHKLRNGANKSVDQILLDLPRTFPALSFFQDHGIGTMSLREVLEAFVLFKPDLGYVQGMSFIAAALLLNMDTYEAFQCMCNILNSNCHSVFYLVDVPKMEQYFVAFDLMLEYYLPNLNKHLREIDLHPRLYLIDWILTIFTKSIPIDIASHIIDIYFFEGEHFLFRAALGLLKFLGNRLFYTDFDESMIMLQSLTAEDIEDHALFGCIKSFNLEEKDLQNFLAMASESTIDDQT